MHCHALQHTVTHYDALQHTATSTTVTIFRIMRVPARIGFCMCAHTHIYALQRAAVHCSALHHTSTHCNTLQHTATSTTVTTFRIMRVPARTSFCMCAHTHMYALQRTAVRCSALQHTVTHCNTLQHTATSTTDTTFQIIGVPARIGFCLCAHTHVYALQRAAMHCHALQHTVTQYDALQHTATSTTVTTFRIMRVPARIGFCMCAHTHIYARTHRHTNTLTHTIWSSQT